MIEVVDDYTHCIALRRKVFIDEQGIAEADEIDDLDDQAIHLLAIVDGRPVGTARLLIDGEIGKIGRICVATDQRGTGLGKALVTAGIDQLRTVPGVTTAKLGAQDHAIGFYAKLGFQPVGDFYDDAGIPHQDMVLAL
ncbi:GNAT family N-acetyltransferase [Cognatiyoonia sp. IB215182]|uniref:GNAT family N-acetyltransferase n=1 Tax=Cognatiyoonia sp. IB215182 TaxID=3097353 RepID=UPI002A0C7247|nr:GNAT family N-acetyltransferase [Cognatiyoonia sp. IB215182]MDX8354226.1 GNAT family N-acetyltransferase [Cognatiyoonia sp. IB215182]